MAAAVDACIDCNQIQLVPDLVVLAGLASPCRCIVDGQLEEGVALAMLEVGMVS